MTTIAIFSTSRAEFGYFKPLLEELEKDSKLTYKLFIGGMHLLEDQGKTIEIIKKLGFDVCETLDFFPEESSTNDLLISASSELELLSDVFETHEFDFTCVFGDRFELLPVVHASLLFKRPIIHIHGGDTVEGGIDEQYRHMYTKASHLHFPVCKEFKENILKMGEAEWRVHNVGSLAVDTIKHEKKLHREELFSELGLNPDMETVVSTYHPETLDYSYSDQEQIKNIFRALDEFDLQVMFTAPNIDSDSTVIRDTIEENVDSFPHYHFEATLGSLRYHNLVRHSKFVLGNSSSGIMEVPYFKIPTVDIGERQKHRIRHKSVIDVDYSVQSIEDGIKQALDQKFRNEIEDMDYKFGDGNAAESILEIVKSISTDHEGNFFKKKLNFSEDST
jgi:UDP-hydrolysing UDP-N-acetyl-D-glucosamine 2-epimerase